MRRMSPLFPTSALSLAFMLGTCQAAAQPSEDDDIEIGDEDEDEGDEDEDEGDEDEDEGDEDEAQDSEEEEPTEAEDESETDDSSEDAGTTVSDEADCEGEDCSSDEELETAKEEANSDASEKKDQDAARRERRARRADKKRAVPPWMNKTPRKRPGPNAEDNGSARVADEAETEEAAQAALTDLPQPGPSLVPLSVTTSTFARLEVREGYDELGVETERRREGDAVFYRARLGLETNPLPVADGADVNLKFSPQATGVWGQTGTFEHPDFGLYEGHMRFRSDRLETYIGRQMIAYGEGIIFGAVGWHHVGRAYDGLKFRYKMDRGYVDFLGLQTAEVHPDGAERLLGGDEYVWGVYSGFGEYVGDDIETDAYMIARSTVAQDLYTDPVSGDVVSAEGGTLFTVGARVKHQVGALDYRFEAGVQFGEAARTFRGVGGVLESPSTFAYQASGEIGISFDSVTRIGIGGDYASGDDLTTRGHEGWDPLFSTFWGWLGNMDVIGLRTNVLSGNLKITRGLTRSLTLDIDGHVFARPEAGGLGQVGDEKFAGVEVDTRLRQKLGEFAAAQGTYGLFIPQSGHYSSDDLASYGEVEVRVEF